MERSVTNRNDDLSFNNTTNNNNANNQDVIHILKWLAAKQSAWWIYTDTVKCEAVGGVNVFQ